MKNIIIREAEEPDGVFAEEISFEMEASAKARGTGIAKRSPASIRQKMREGKAVIAVTDDNSWVGFAYIEVWSHGDFVSNSGMIVSPLYRRMGVASGIKLKIFELSGKKYPHAKIFSITTGLTIMKMNAALGFQPVTFDEVAKDKAFWSKCSSCINYKILQNQQFKNCLCTALMYNPQDPGIILPL